MSCEPVLTRAEYRCGNRTVALIREGNEWEMILEGHFCGRFVGPDAYYNAVDAIPRTLKAWPPEHPHPQGNPQ